MTAAGVRTDEITGYLAKVKAALADLDPATRDGLLEDLPDHLSEVVAADPAPLATRLGPPGMFAAELRSAAGLAGAGDGNVSGPQHPSMSTVDLLRSVFELVDRGIGRLLGYDRLATLLVVLQPTWWILRGAAVAFVVDKFYGFGRGPALLPLLTIAVIASIRFGRVAKLAETGGPRVISVVVSVMCVVPTIVMFVVILTYR